MLERLREWIPKLEAERSAEAQVFRDRLKSIEGLIGMVDAMAESFLKGGMVRQSGSQGIGGCGRAQTAGKSVRGQSCRVLVTGATGFIGSHLTRRLESAGHTVLSVSRRAEAHYNWSDDSLAEAGRRRSRRGCASRRREPGRQALERGTEAAPAIEPL
jgi:hypothetical protein